MIGPSATDMVTGDSDDEEGEDMEEDEHEVCLTLIMFLYYCMSDLVLC